MGTGIKNGILLCRVVKSLQPLLLLLEFVLFYVAPTIGISRVEQLGVTLEEMQQSQLVEQGTAILSLYCHQPLVGDDNDDDDKLTFLEPTASGLKLQ